MRTLHLLKIFNRRFKFKAYLVFRLSKRLYIVFVKTVHILNAVKQYAIKIDITNGVKTVEKKLNMLTRERILVKLKFAIKSAILP